MKVFVTGATGLLGRRLVVDRLARGDRVTVLSRHADAAEQLFAAEANRNVDVLEGTPAAPGPWQQHIDGCDVVVVFAGANIAARRWTAAYRRSIEDSRLDSTYQVARAIGAAARPPALLISASAVGIYGETGAGAVDEAAAPGTGALSQLAARWEEQAERARGPGRRVALLRLAPILDARGGMLGRLVPIFRLGLGGPWGPGTQDVAWIHWRDVISIIDFVIETDAVDGPVNVAAPERVTAREFARTLGRVMRRPAIVPAPTLALRVVLGPLAAHLAESSAVEPALLQRLGYRFLHPRLEPALRAALDAAPEHAPPSPAGASAAPPATVQLVAIGVDGTMLRSDGQLPVSVVNACRAAEQAGCTVVAASSRSPRGLAALADALQVRGPMIACNGAVVWSSIDGRAQHHQALDAETAKEVVDAVRAAHPDVLVALESIDSWYTDRLDPALEDGPVLEPDEIGPLAQFLDRPITRIEQLAGDAAVMQSVTAVLRERFWQLRRISMFAGAANVVHVMHPMVDKGIALQRIAARLGIERRHVMAIGDAENDQGMIEWAGFGVAVGNASAAVQGLADIVVPSNDDLGVAHAIQQFVLGESGGGSS